MSESDLPPGFRFVSGKRGPRNKDKEYTVMFRRKGQDPFIDWNRTYTANDLVWTDDGGSWCVVAVCEVGGDTKKGKTAALCSKRTNGVANLSPHNGECIAYGCKTAPIALDKA